MELAERRGIALTEARALLAGVNLTAAIAAAQSAPEPEPVEQAVAHEAPEVQEAPDLSAPEEPSPEVESPAAEVEQDDASETPRSPRSATPTARRDELRGARGAARGARAGGAPPPLNRMC